MNETPKADWKAILAIILCGLVWLVWQNRSWKQQQERAAAAQKTAIAQQHAAVSGTAGSMAMTGSSGGNATATATAGGTGTGSTTGTSTAVAAAPTPAPAPAAKKVTLSNKVLDLELSSAGARPVSADLKEYTTAIDTSKDAGLVQLVSSSNEGVVPLQAWFGTDKKSVLPAEAPFELVRSGDNEAVFHYTAPDGLSVTRTYTTSPEDYVVQVTDRFANAGSAPIRGQPGVVWSANLRGATALRTTGEFEAIARSSNRTHHGNPKKPGDRSWLIFPVSEFEEFRYPGKVDWVAIGDRYFVAAVIPLEPEFNGADDVRVFHPGEHSIASLAIGPELTLAPGETRDVKYEVFLGPKDYSVLKRAGHGLGDTIDWGNVVIAPFSKGFWALFRWMHSLVGNWAISIVILTIIIRGALSPLAARQMKMSQDFAGKSQRLKPQLEALKKKYAEDPMALNRETMLLYKQHGLSPFSPMMGCLPMAAQLPIWWALDKVLVYSIDLRHQPLGLWIHDLAAPDPYKVLPILLGLVMFVQVKLTPQAPGTDPAQQKMMAFIMPVMFTVFMLTLPAGLVLYIFISTFMSIIQQYYLRRKYPMGGTGTPAVARQTKEAKEAT